MNTDKSDATVNIEVAFGTAERQVLKKFSVMSSATVIEVVLQADLGVEFPDVDWRLAKKGIYGRVVPDTQVVQEGDRIEVYRPLLMTPQDARRKRAKKGDG